MEKLLKKLANIFSIFLVLCLVIQLPLPLSAMVTTTGTAAGTTASGFANQSILLSGQMLSTKQNITSSIKTDSNEALLVLSQKYQTAVADLTAIKAKALADPDINEKAVQNKYVAQVNDAQKTAIHNLGAVVTKYAMQIDNDVQNGQGDLDALVNQGADARMAANYQKAILSQATLEKYNLNEELFSNEALLKKQVESITQATVPASKGVVGDTIAWIKSFVDSAGGVVAEVLGGVTTVAAGVKLGLASIKYIKNKMGLGAELKTEERPEGFESISKVIDSVFAAKNKALALKKVLEKAPDTVVEKYAQEIRESLGLNEKQFKDVLDSYSNAKDLAAQLGDLSGKISEVVNHVSSGAGKGVSNTEILEQVGRQIEEGARLTSANFAENVTHALASAAPVETRFRGGTPIEGGGVVSRSERILEPSMPEPISSLGRALQAAKGVGQRELASTRGQQEESGTESENEPGSEKEGDSVEGEAP